MPVEPFSSVAGKPAPVSASAASNETPRFLRRKAAGAYLIEKYGFGAPRTLAKAAVTGDGPEYHKAGRVVLYTRDALDKWALAKIGAARRSTSAA
jgi:hypothetical protein